MQGVWIQGSWCPQPTSHSDQSSSRLSKQRACWQAVTMHHSSLEHQDGRRHAWPSGRRMGSPISHNIHAHSSGTTWPLLQPQSTRPQPQMQAAPSRTLAYPSPEPPRRPAGPPAASSPLARVQRPPPPLPLPIPRNSQPLQPAGAAASSSALQQPSVQLKYLDGIRGIGTVMMQIDSLDVQPLGSFGCSPAARELNVGIQVGWGAGGAARTTWHGRQRRGAGGSACMHNMAWSPMTYVHLHLACMSGVVGSQLVTRCSGLTVYDVTAIRAHGVSCYCHQGSRCIMLLPSGFMVYHATAIRAHGVSCICIII